MSFNFVVRKTYSFDVYPANILGSGFQNVTVMAELDPESAGQLIDITARHIQVFSYLPAGTPNDPTAYNYLKLKLQSGEVTVVGIPWIVENTIQEVTAQTITVKVVGVGPQDVQRVNNALVANGFTVADIQLA